MSPINRLPRQRDITNVIKGVEAAGYRLDDVRICIDDGVVYITGANTTAESRGADLDKWMIRNARETEGH